MLNSLLSGIRGLKPGLYGLVKARPWNLLSEILKFMEMETRALPELSWMGLEGFPVERDCDILLDKLAGLS